MSYNIQELEQVEVLLHDQVKNKAILPWIDHLLDELKEKVNFKGDLNHWDIQKDMLQGATSWIHYISSACADIVYTQDLLMRHYQNQKLVDQLWDKIYNDKLSSDYGIRIAASDLDKAAQLIQKALYLTILVKQVNKEVK